MAHRSYPSRGGRTKQHEQSSHLRSKYGSSKSKKKKKDASGGKTGGTAIGSAGAS